MTRRLSALLTFALIASSALWANSAPSIFRSANPKDNQNADCVHLLKGFNLMQKDDSDGALIEFNHCKNILLASDSVIVEIGKYFEISAQPDVGAAILTKLINYAKTASPAVSPQDLAQALRCRGDCLYQQSLFEAAYADFKKAAVIYPQNSGYSYRMAADCCRRQKKYEEALKLFALSPRFGYKSLELHYQKGQCLSEMKRYAEAVTEFNQIIDELMRIRQKSPDSYTELFRKTYAGRANCHDALGEKAAAAEDRRALAELGKSWEEDLFGNSSATKPHR